jgi:hypothetical protein
MVFREIIAVYSENHMKLTKSVFVKVVTVWTCTPLGYNLHGLEHPGLANQRFRPPYGRLPKWLIKIGLRLYRPGISPACTLTRVTPPDALPHGSPIPCPGHRACTPLCFHHPGCNNVNLCHRWISLMQQWARITLLQQWPWISLLPFISVLHL